MARRRAAILLEAQDVSVQFGGLRALNRVSFGVQDGEIVGLVGSNGTGKSTMVTAVSGGRLDIDHALAAQPRPTPRDECLSGPRPLYRHDGVRRQPNRETAAQSCRD